MNAFLAGLIALSGGGIALLVVVFLNPDKVQIWTTWIWRGLRLLTRRAEYRLIASDVSSQLNANVLAELREQLDGISVPGVSLRWDNDSTAIAREVAGTMIIRMRPHEDRAMNIFAASLAATAQLVVPTLRSDLSPEQSEGIDLQLCRRVATRLHQSAMVRYRLEIVEPAVARVPALPPMLERLHVLDVSGLFIPVLLQELLKVEAGADLKRLPGLADEVARFVQFLTEIADREPSELVTLTFVEQYIRVNIMLVARRNTRAIGVAPYRRRVTSELGKGVDTVYVLATGENMSFAQDVAGALDADRRLTRQRDKNLTIMRATRTVRALIVPFERNGNYASHDFFRDTLASAGIATGGRVTGTVLDVQDLYVTVDIFGLNGVIDVRDVDWGWCEDCRAKLQIGQDVECVVIAIDMSGLELRLSRRACLRNPTEGMLPADVDGKPFTFLVSGIIPASVGRPSFAVGSLDNGLAAKLLADEYDWGTSEFDNREMTPGAQIEVIGLRLLSEQGMVAVSRKRRSVSKWDVLRAKYPKDHRLEVRVTAVEEKGVFCEIEPGVTGFVPADQFRQAGFEYADFQENVTPGQRLYVAVSRVVAGERNRVSLVLQRNLH